MNKWIDLINRYNPNEDDLCDLLDEAEKVGREDAEKELKEKYLDADAYNEGLADGRADAIDECITKLLTESITCFSDVISVLEQLKENRE